ncbi:transposase (plasmid) [Streptomyces sp. HUAS TT11]|uniref:transposase n=1 Tax=Streptomyces sp. HUAS TT11 TaxID=3447508 RepID=UPI003F655124
MRNRLAHTTTEWQRRYTIRAGVEAPLSQNVRAHGRLRHWRYRGLAKSHGQHVLTALACNVARIAEWVDTASTADRRSSRFVRRSPPRHDPANVTNRATALCLGTSHGSVKSRAAARTCAAFFYAATSRGLPPALHLSQ